MSRDCYLALPRVAMCLSAVCDCGISWSYSPFLKDRTMQSQCSCMVLHSPKEISRVSCKTHKNKFNLTCLADARVENAT